jgi:threonylcarbamoyladenosine tRNA methylthiotransferase MtaB
MGNEDKDRLPQILEESGVFTKSAGKQFEVAPGMRSRAFLKVQDGCDSFCAYCIVPFVRPNKVCLPAGEVVAQVKKRVSEGYKEVLLTGTEIGGWRDGGLNLADLLERILDETGIERLRLSSLQPQEVSPRLVGLWQNPRLCRHFHLSLQSGSDSVLKRMRRRYTTDGYRQAVLLIRSVVPDAAITTDVIVGFPGETDVEFAESLEFCKEIGFARIHVFSYSARPGTAASVMPGQVGDRVKKERSREMLKLAGESAAAFHKMFLGQTLTVLWEQQVDGLWNGLTDNYIRVYIKSDEDLTNRITEVKLEKQYKDGVITREKGN